MSTPKINCTGIVLFVEVRSRTPLHLACYAGSLDAARLLIESGADVNAIGMDSVRPLAFAVMKNHIEIVLLFLFGIHIEVRLLLTNGAVSGINAKFNKDSTTCLLVAAKNNNKDMVKLLLDMGSNPNLSNKQGQRPIDVCNDEDVFPFLRIYN